MRLAADTASMLPARPPTTPAALKLAALSEGKD